MNKLFCKMSENNKGRLSFAYLKLEEGESLCSIYWKRNPIKFQTRIQRLILKNEIKKIMVLEKRD